MFADVSQWTAPVGLAAAMSCGVFLLIAFNQAAKAWRVLKGQDPQPPNSQLATSVSDLERRVTLAEGAMVGIQAEYRTDREAVRAELKADREATEIHISQRSSRIYEEIKECREGLEAKIEAVEHSFVKHSQDIERSLGRIEGKLDK